MPGSRGTRSEAGETLVELIVAVAILGIAGVAVLGGMLLNVKASALNRNQAGGGAYVRSAVEAIQKKVDNDGSYASCADAASSTGAYSTAANGTFSSADLSNGYGATVLQVQSWKGGASGWGTCDTNGIQRIQLQVTTLGDASHKATETLYVVLRKPCSGGALAQDADPCA